MFQLVCLERTLFEIIEEPMIGVIKARFVVSFLFSWLGNPIHDMLTKDDVA